MIAETFSTYLASHWRGTVELLLLPAAIYLLWLTVRAARGARLLIGLAILLVVVTLISELLELRVVSWILRNLTTFLAFAMLVIFQPELRRKIVALGSHRLLAFGTQTRESVAMLAEAAFELANRQLGALIAVERETSLEHFAESGVIVDSALSAELLVTIFHPKTPLHDGGVIVRADRIVAAAAIFPVSQRVDLDRNLGLRHRAGLGLTEENDAVIIVVSEETGIVSLCHRGVIERNFDPEGFKSRLDELLILESDAEDARSLGTAREDRSSRPRRSQMGSSASSAESDDRLAF